MTCGLRAGAWVALLAALALTGCSEGHPTATPAHKAAVRSAVGHPAATRPATPRPSRDAEASAHPTEPDPLAELTPQGVDSLVAAGVAAFAEGRDASAVSSFLLALEVEPDHAEAHYGMGLLLAKDGRWSRAVEAFAEAATHAPEWSEAHVELGLALHAQGRAQLAISVFDRALRLEPNHERARFNRGLALRSAGQVPAARRDLERLRPSPRYGAASQVELALLRLRVGGPGAERRAHRYLRGALRSAPRSPSAHYNLGLLLIRAGHVHEGRRHLNLVHGAPYAALAAAALAERPL